MTQSWQVYETNLLYDETLAGWRREGLEVRHDAEDTSRPAGVAYVSNKGVHLCTFGRKARVELYFNTVEDRDANLSLLSSKGVYPKGEEARWTPTNKKKLQPSYFLSVEKHSLEVDVIKYKLQSGLSRIGRAIRHRELKRPLLEIVSEHQRDEPLDPKIWEAGRRVATEYYTKKGTQPPEFLSEAIYEMLLSYGRDIPLEKLAELSKVQEKNDDAP